MPLYVTSKKCCGGYLGSSLVNDLSGQKQRITWWVTSAGMVRLRIVRVYCSWLSTSWMKHQLNLT